MSIGYKEISVSKHPKKRPNGCVHEHVLVAEEILGRFLCDEVVHHIDEDKRNNLKSNLQIFESQSAHARFHTGVYKELYCIENIWYCTKLIKNKQYVDINSIRKVKNRPNKQELIELLIENNFVKVGKMYNVTDNAIRRWCDYYGISRRASDYK